jgi:hypothetical protein
MKSFAKAGYKGENLRMLFLMYNLAKRAGKTKAKNQ